MEHTDFDLIGILKTVLAAGILYWIFGPIGLACYALYKLSRIKRD